MERQKAGVLSLIEFRMSFATKIYTNLPTDL